MRPEAIYDAIEEKRLEENVESTKVRCPECDSTHIFLAKEPKQIYYRCLRCRQEWTLDLKVI